MANGEPQLFLPVARGKQGQEINVGNLLADTGKLAIVYGNRTYLLRRTPKGGLQLCAVADQPAPANQG